MEDSSTGTVQEDSSCAEGVAVAKRFFVGNAAWGLGIEASIDWEEEKLRRTSLQYTQTTL